MDDIEWIIHEIKVEIDEAMHRIELEIVYNKNNPEAHYHVAKFSSCDRPNCAGYSPIWLLRTTLDEALKNLIDKYPHPTLNSTIY